MVADLFAASLRAPRDFVDEDAVKSELDNLRQNRDVIEASIWLSGRDAPMDRIGERRVGASTPEHQGKNGVLPDRVRVSREVTASEGKVVGAAVVDFSLARENARFVEKVGTTFCGSAWRWRSPRWACCSSSRAAKS